MWAPLPVSPVPLPHPPQRLPKRACGIKASRATRYKITSGIAWPLDLTQPASPFIPALPPAFAHVCLDSSGCPLASASGVFPLAFPCLAPRAASFPSTPGSFPCNHAAGSAQFVRLSAYLHSLPGPSLRVSSATLLRLCPFYRGKKRRLQTLSPTRGSISAQGS